MSFPRVLISTLAVLLLGSACISLPDIDSAEEDAGPPVNLTVNLLAPSETALTNDIVDVQVQVTGGTPDKVELLVADQLLTTLSSPYTYRWSTRPVAEGTHQLIAKATLGSKTFTSETREVVVDRTPPQVASRTPAPGAQDIWVRQPIEATFSEPIKASTVTSNAVHLAVGTTEVAATPLLSADGKKLTVTPSSRVLVPNTVKLTFSTTITDMAGNALATPSDTWTWNLPTAFPMGSLDAVTGALANDPVLQVDGKGNPIVAWLEGSATNSGLLDVHTSIWNGLTWQELGSQTSALPFMMSLENAQLDLQVDQSDRPIAAWVHLDDSNKGRVVVRRWTATEWQSVGEPLDMASTVEFSARPYPVALQISKDNHPIVAWENHDYATQASLLHIMQWSGSEWEQAGTPISIMNTGGRARPSLAVENTGKPVIAWADYEEGGVSGIRVGRWTSNGWEFLGQRVEANTQPNTPTDNPNLLLEAGATPIIAWSESDGATTNIHVRRLANNVWEPLGGALSAVPGNTPAINPRLQMDAALNLFVVWHEEDENRGQLARIRRWTGSTWEEIGDPVGAVYYGWSFKLAAPGTPFIATLHPGTTDAATVHVMRYNH